MGIGIAIGTKLKIEPGQLEPIFADPVIRLGKRQQCPVLPADIVERERLLIRVVGLPELPLIPARRKHQCGDAQRFQSPSRK